MIYVNTNEIRTLDNLEGSNRAGSSDGEFGAVDSDEIQETNRMVVMTLREMKIKDLLTFEKTANRRVMTGNVQYLHVSNEHDWKKEKVKETEKKTKTEVRKLEEKKR
ncbi:uncharacterized protein [Periplaneta americana]|uniref:uncharacterized protein n=1 Tax=Periplaneta americana TaxID=6978 RepID=UPI0037E73919